LDKPLTPEFWQKCSARKDGVQVYCRDCKSEINLARYHTLPKVRPVEEPERSKKCTSCKKVKTLTEKNWPANAYGWSSHCRDCVRTRLKELKRSYRLRVLEHYSEGTPKCSCCGETELVFLAVDHIDGGGRKHHQEVGTSGEFSKWIIDNGFPDNLRVLCHNCNMGFARLGYCPHNPPANRKLNAVK
jgi:hypothetical protein